MRVYVNAFFSDYSRSSIRFGTVYEDHEQAVQSVKQDRQRYAYIATVSVDIPNQPFIEKKLNKTIIKPNYTMPDQELKAPEYLKKNNAALYYAMLDWKDKHPVEFGSATGKNSLNDCDKYQLLIAFQRMLGMAFNDMPGEKYVIQYRIHDDKI